MRWERRYEMKEKEGEKKKIYKDNQLTRKINQILYIIFVCEF